MFHARRQRTGAQPRALWSLPVLAAWRPAHTHWLVVGAHRLAAACCIDHSERAPSPLRAIALVIAKLAAVSGSGSGRLTLLFKRNLNDKAHP